jgi:hypothetical protein
MTSSVRALLAVLVIGAGASRVDAQARQEPWSASVVALNTGGDRGSSRTIWVGFKNESKMARLACVTSFFGYLVQTDGATPSSAAQALMHDCQVDEKFHWVLPAQTLYHPFVLEVPVWRDSSSLRLELLVVARDKKDDERASLTWTGTVGEAIAAGKKLGF